MKILYFDSPMGVSGNMILGALLDLGALSYKSFTDELKKLDLPASGYRIKNRQVRRCGISAKEITVTPQEKNPPCRSFNTICKLIQKSKISTTVREKSIKVFERLAKAESEVHRVDVQEIHFHEVGAVDAIIDIVGSVILLQSLNIDKILVSPLPTGGGFVKTAHGLLPIPAPATLKLLNEMFIRETPVDMELTTPTGASIVSTLAKSVVGFPVGKIIKSGIGAGSVDCHSIPNILRAVLLQQDTDTGHRYEKITRLECQMDDISPEWIEYAIDSLIDRGALDVIVSPVIMKKSRPGFVLTIYCSPEDKERFISWVIRESTTLGVRVEDIDRFCLQRKIRTIKTSYGMMRVKIAEYEGVKKIKPEYEDIKAAAKKYNKTFIEVLKSVEKVCYHIFDDEKQ